MAVRARRHALAAWFRSFIPLRGRGRCGADGAVAAGRVGAWAVWCLGAEGTDGGWVGADVDVAGTVPLTAALVDRVAEGDLGCLDAGEVVPFLRARLGWRAAVVSLCSVPLWVLCCVIGDLGKLIVYFAW